MVGLISLSLENIMQYLDLMQYIYIRIKLLENIFIQIALQSQLCLQHFYQMYYILQNIYKQADYQWFKQLPLSYIICQNQECLLLILWIIQYRRKLIET